MVVLLSAALAELENRKQPAGVYAKMETNVGCDAGKTNCIMVRLIDGGDGYTARPILGKSGLISTLTASDGYVVTGRNLEGIKENETVKVRLFK